MLRTVVKIAGATLAFGLVHSLFASTKVKNAVRNRVGERNRNGLYRAFYVGQSAVTLMALIAYGRKQPNKTLYEVRGKAAGLMWAGQVYSLVAQLHTVQQIGILKFTGLSGLWAWARGAKEIAPEPEGQGPSQDDSGDMRARGWFQVSRHPLNFLALAILWLQPRMTVRWASFSVIATLYFFFGSFHEETRLRARYGRSYRDYERSGNGFYLPQARIRKPSLPPFAGENGAENSRSADETPRKSG